MSEAADQDRLMKLESQLQRLWRHHNMLGIAVVIEGVSIIVLGIAAMAS